MKKLIALILALVMALSLAACQKAPAETPAPAANNDNAVADTPNTDAPADTEKPAETEAPASSGDSRKVGLSFALMDAGMTALSGLIQDTLLSNDPNLEIFLTSADGNSEKQLSDIEDLIAKECDIIYIMAADMDAIVPAIDAIHKAGILCGVAQNIDSENYDFMYASAPSELPGEIQGQWLADYIAAHPDETFNVAHCSGTSTNSGAVARRDGCYDKLMNAGLDNVNWIVEQDCGYVTETAQACMEGWLLSHPEINVVCCANDDMALGVANAVQAAGRNDIMILGIDGHGTGIDLINKGQAVMSVRMNVEFVGSGAADAILAMLNGTPNLPQTRSSTATWTRSTWPWMRPMSPTTTTDRSEIKSISEHLDSIRHRPKPKEAPRGQRNPFKRSECF